MEDLSTKIKNYYNRLQLNAEMTANKNLELALSSESFKKVYYEYKKAELSLSIALVCNDKEKIAELKKILTRLEHDKISELNKLSLSLSDLEPKYACSLCKDTGFIGVNKCKCYEKIQAKLALTDIGVNLKNLPTFDDDNLEKSNNLKDFYEKFKKFAIKYPKTTFKHIIFTGTIGTSKTFLAACIANEIARKGFNTTFLTSFQMNDIFIKYYSIFDKERSSYMDSITNADFLVIDDLGAGQNIKNITTEYFLTLLNERDLRGNTTLITTNLTPTEILDTYHERVYSRLFNKKISVTLDFDGDDLRLKK